MPSDGTGCSNAIYGPDRQACKGSFCVRMSAFRAIVYQTPVLTLYCACSIGLPSQGHFVNA